MKKKITQKNIKAGLKTKIVKEICKLSIENKFTKPETFF